MLTLLDQFKFACRCGNLEKVKLMLKTHPELELKCSFAAMWASTFGNFEVVRYLAEFDPNFHEWSNSCLKMATKRSHVNIVEYLLQRGMRHDDLLMDEACKTGNLAVIELFLEHGAKPPRWRGKISKEVFDFCSCYKPLSIKFAGKES